jgi:hypothetical protein
MPSDDEVTQRAGSLRAMTGLTATEFQALLPVFEHAVERALATRTIDGQPRTSRRYRAYAHGPLPTMADKLLFILSYLKHHPIQERQGELFGMSQSHANKCMHLLHAALTPALVAQALLPARTADELVARLARRKPEGTSPSPLFGTTGRSDRSNVREMQQSRKPNDRGKKKRHTLKNLLLITETCHVCFLSSTCEGQASDKAIAEQAGYRLPPGSRLDQDQGCQGFYLPNVLRFQPQKKPCGRDLPSSEKATNRRISSIRIRIQHAIGGVKRSRIVKETIRLLKAGLRDTVMETCCGLHNFRLLYRPWNYAL